MASAFVTVLLSCVLSFSTFYCSVVNMAYHILINKLCLQQNISNGQRVINVGLWNSLPSTVRPNFTSPMAFRRSLNNVDFGSHIHCRLE